MLWVCCLAVEIKQYNQWCSCSQLRWDYKSDDKAQRTS